MFLLSLVATYQLWRVPPKAGLSTYKAHAGDGEQRPLCFSFQPRLKRSVRLQPTGCLGVNKRTVFCRNIPRYWIWRRICRSIRCPASSEKECADPLGPRSMRAFDMDIVLLHTGAPWPLCVLWMAISRLLCGAQVHSILSQYQSEYPAILDIATYLSLNKL
jgi:hypothetical protein